MESVDINAALISKNKDNVTAAAAHEKSISSNCLFFI